MVDEIFRSMKRQMVPSDQVVNDLLNKIAILEAQSTDNSSSNSNTLDNMPTKEIYPKKSKSFTKTIKLYGTIAVAGFVVVTGTFALLGGLSSDDKSLEVFNQVVNNNNVVIQEEIPKPDEPKSNSDKKDDKSDKSKEDKKAASKHNSKKKDGKKSTEGDKTPSASKDKKSPSENEENDNKPKSTPPKEDDGKITPVNTPNNSKVTPGIAGENNISWNREILADEHISNLRISGNNYVVPTVADTPITTSKVKSISLKLDETSTTNRATVEATVEKVKNVSQDFMVVLSVDGFTEKLLYINENYTPSNLGQLISDTGLGNAFTYHNRVMVENSKTGYPAYKQVRVTNLAALVKEHILVNDASPASYDSYVSASDFALFKSTNNPFGKKIDFGVCNKGYVLIKIPGTKTFTFNIGAENAKAFLGALTNN